jgi:hypothetical protein
VAFDPPSLLDVSHLVVFLGGTAVGAAGKYLADRFTDQRREQEAARKERRRFKELQTLMPDLFREMAKDLRNDADGLTREFVLLSSRVTAFDGRGKPRFAYFETEHPQQRSQIDLLRTEGYLEDATIQDIPIFRMSEHFVRLLKERA